MILSRSLHPDLVESVTSRRYPELDLRLLESISTLQMHYSLKQSSLEVSMTILIHGTSIA